MEILHDRAGASRGVIDGFDGENLLKAVAAYIVPPDSNPALRHCLQSKALGRRCHLMPKPRPKAANRRKATAPGR
jgi:hypothetical protein